MGTGLDRRLPPKSRADDSGAVRIDIGGHLQDFSCRRDHQLPGLDHNELPIGIPKVPDNPDRLGLAVRGGEDCEMVHLRQREAGVQIRVYDDCRDVVGLTAREDDRVQGNRSNLPVVEVAESPGGCGFSNVKVLLTCWGPSAHAAVLPAAGASTPNTVPTASAATMMNRLTTAP
jgi:hypothetical protein